MTLASVMSPNWAKWLSKSSDLALKLMLPSRSCECAPPRSGEQEHQHRSSSSAPCSQDEAQGAWQTKLRGRRKEEASGTRPKPELLSSSASG
eukprot:CAMPEP_0184289144 /NCGR_PEP_ID=MMETSP1049-20130417/1585_1 /TAXON_ID=77928 /ORGANISM="Proteomonas sulcata, Strain CCMP704" /LENGTH=91 /DNA_ID=CAMNT_0026595807 /DNA_START=429 /DNA_END=705 /DNA_ORIENTATION=-